MGKNPFNTYDSSFATSFEQRALDVFKARPAVSPQDIANQAAQSQAVQTPVNVALPPHLFVPQSSQTVSLQGFNTFLPGTSGVLTTFTAPQGVVTNFISYTLYCDTSAVLGAAYFTPTVNGQRVFPFHGITNSEITPGYFTIAAPPPIANGTVITAQLRMNPGEVLTWTFTNTTLGNMTAGVIMSGYIDSTIKRNNSRFGG